MYLRCTMNYRLNLLFVLMTRFLPTTRERTIKLRVKCPGLRINCLEKIDGLFIALTVYTNSMWWGTIIYFAALGKTLLRVLRLAEISIRKLKN